MHNPANSEAAYTSAFTSALTRAYNAHLSEVKALQHEVQKQRQRSEQQEETIKKLTSNVKRMKQAVIFAKTKVIKEISLQRKLRAELEKRNIPLPFKLSDSSSSDEDEDCIVVNQSPMSSDSPVTTTVLSLFTESPSNPSDAPLAEHTKSSPTLCGGRMETSMCTSTSPCSSIVLSTSSRKKKMFEKDEICQMNRTEVQMKGKPEVEGTHALQKQSRIKYRDISRDKVDCLVQNCPSESVADPIPSHCQYSQSNSPSPSLLHAPTSWQLEDSVQDIRAGRDFLQGAKNIVASAFPLSDTQLSLNVSQNIPESLQLPPLPKSSPHRKRKCSATLSEHFEHSVLEVNQILPHINSTSQGPSCTKLSHEDTPQCLIRPTAAVLPKTPGIRAVSSAVPFDKSFFNGVKRTKHFTDSLCYSRLLPRVSDTAKSGTRDSGPTGKTTNISQSIGATLEDNPGATELNSYTNFIAARAGLPTYKCSAIIRNHHERNLLDAKECPDCKSWYSGDDGIHCNRMDHLKHTCRHKQLYQRQDTDPKMWDISFPDSEECDKLLNTPK